MTNTFDFLVGTWTSTQRRLRKILAGSDDWYEFPATARCWNLMGGAGNVDEIHFPTEGFSGATLRLYDPATELWSLYWASTRTGLTLPPMVGINAIPDAIAAIEAGRMLATANFDPMAMSAIAVEAVVRHLKGERVPAEIILPVQIIDAGNSAAWNKPYEERPLPVWDDVIASL